MDNLFGSFDIPQDNVTYNLVIKSLEKDTVILELHRLGSDEAKVGDCVARSTNHLMATFQISSLIDETRNLIANCRIDTIVFDESVIKLSRDDLAREFIDGLSRPGVLQIKNRDKDRPPKYPIDPLDVVTSQFKPERIVHKDATFVMAEGRWADEPLPVIAVRWHEPGKIGYPNGFGKPQWMLTPIDPKAIKSMENPFLPNAIRIEMLGDTREVSVGSWAKTEHDWHLITYVYGDDGQMVSACGLGKPGAYPLRLDDIEQVVTEGRSLMDIWFQDVMGGDICLWSTPTGRIWLTFKTPPAMIWSKKNPKNVYSGVELIKSPLMDTWYYGKAEEKVFDYMLDDHILLGRISPKDVSKPELDEEVVDYIELRRWAVDIVNHAIWMDVLDVDKKKHTFEDDVKSAIPDGELEHHRFAHDIVMGCGYIDLTDLTD